MKPTEKQLSKKLKEIEKFEKKWRAEHGISSIYGMKKYCTNARYRELVDQFTEATINTYKVYRFKTPYNDWD